MQESLLMDDSDSDENVLFAEKDSRKPLTSTHDEEESD